MSELWRYPVKSLRGERVDVADIREEGIAGDRIVHVRESSGRVATSRYRPGLLGLAGTLGEDGEPFVDGVLWSEPSVLERVRAVTEPQAELVRFEGVDHGQRFDVLPLTVLTESMARAVGYDHRRFRPNLLIADAPDDAELHWAGYGLRVGGALIGVLEPKVAVRDDDLRSRHARARSDGAPPRRSVVRRPRRARLPGGASGRGARR